MGKQIDINPKMLSDDEIISIMEATKRFEYLGKVETLYGFAHLRFYDFTYDNEYTIRNDSTIVDLMKFIVFFFSDESFKNGQFQAKLEIRKAIGVD